MRNKNFWILLLLLLAGIVLGGFIGNLTAGIPMLSWLSFGQSFGITPPINLDLGILVITFGMSIKITMASIIGIVIAATIMIVPVDSFTSLGSAAVNVVCLAVGVAAALALDRFNSSIPKQDD